MRRSDRLVAPLLSEGHLLRGAVVLDAFLEDPRTERRMAGARRVEET